MPSPGITAIFLRAALFPSTGWNVNTLAIIEYNMKVTALQAQSDGLAAASVGEYGGAKTAARFGDPREELAALRSGCGVYDLGFRAKIFLTGEDRVRWLNGMVTNNIRDLAVGRGVYAFLLNPQGRILGDLYAYNRGESIAVDTDLSQAEKILATFDHYIIMDDVEVKNLSEDQTALGIGGPRWAETLKTAGIAVPEMQILQIDSISWEGIECSLVRGERENYEIWLPSKDVRRLWNSLLVAGATPVGFEALELQRIESGVPAYGIDIRERDLPQETEQDRALNFSKGCYVGQEIVERIRSRGAVHRKFTGFLIDAPVTPGTKVAANGKDIGEITSVAALPVAADRTIALGYIRREVGAPGREVMIGTTKATVVQLPLRKEMLQRNESSLEQRPA
jgi:folate-binding protein YgfZ